MNSGLTGLLLLDLCETVDRQVNTIKAVRRRLWAYGDKTTSALAPPYTIEERTADRLYRANPSCQPTDAEILVAADGTLRNIFTEYFKPFASSI